MPWEEQWGATDGKGNMRIPHFPPTVFYQMERDKKTTRQIEKALAIFKKNNIKADSIWVSARPPAPAAPPACLHPPSPATTAARITGSACLPAPQPPAALASSLSPCSSFPAPPAPADSCPPHHPRVDV